MIYAGYKGIRPAISSGLLQAMYVDTNPPWLPPQRKILSLSISSLDLKPSSITFRSQTSVSTDISVVLPSLPIKLPPPIKSKIYEAMPFPAKASA